MFHAPMVRFQLELIYYFTYFSTDVPSNIQQESNTQMLDGMTVEK